MLAADVVALAPDCAHGPHLGINTLRTPISHTTFTEDHIATAYCKAGRCVIEQEKQMATSSIFESGWTTSASGDMKNGGLPTPVATRPAEPSAKWPFGDRMIKAEPRTEFDLDLASLKSSKNVQEYHAYPPLMDSYSDAMSKMTPEEFRMKSQGSYSRDEQGYFVQDKAPTAPAADRDTPEGSLLDAW
jgi:septal ring-binding cell division protein DamX